MRKEIIECKTVYRYKKRNITLDKCWIIVDGCKYAFAFLVMNSEDMKHFSLRSKEWSEKLFEYRLDKDFGKIIDKNHPNRRFNLKRSHITGVKSYTRNCHIMILDIDILEYCSPVESHDDNGKRLYYLSPISSIMRHSLPSCFTDKGIERNDLSIEFEGQPLMLHFDDSVNLISFIAKKDGGEASNKDFENLRLLLSLYFHVPVEIWFIDSSKDGVLSRKFFQIKSINGDNRPNCLDYLDIGAQNELAKFIMSVHFYEDEKKRDIIKRAILQYVNAQYLDNNYKYVSLFSILLTIAEKVHDISEGDEYHTISKLIKQYGIAPQKLDEGISEKKYVSLRNQEPINTFADLRDEIIHALTSSEILDNLPVMISLLRLEFCVLIVLLNELGINEVEFYENFKNLSIFK